LTALAAAGCICEGENLIKNLINRLRPVAGVALGAWQ